MPPQPLACWQGRVGGGYNHPHTPSPSLTPHPSPHTRAHTATAALIVNYSSGPLLFRVNFPGTRRVYIVTARQPCDAGGGRESTSRQNKHRSRPLPPTVWKTSGPAAATTTTSDTTNIRLHLLTSLHIHYLLVSL